MADRLQAAEGMEFQSGKIYTHSQGLSCCFRQWRADNSHCKYLHGYSLQVEITFESLTLDKRNWVMNFGGLKPFKAWLEETFDHKTLVAIDDPEIETFKDLASGPKVIQLVIVPHVGCEAFAKMIYDWLDAWLLMSLETEDIWVEAVTVREHAGNFATYRRAG